MVWSSSGSADPSSPAKPNSSEIQAVEVRMARSLMEKLGSGASVVVFAALMAGQAAAQSTADFIGAFSGEWYVFDPAFRSGGSECRINLGANAAGIAGTGTLPVSS